jgi:ribose/xylose/arabinose/galactoside ABC-type transport system permease subunit
MFGLFVLVVVVMQCAFTRTKWGRSMTAVGGNPEAARQAGIDVRRVYTSAIVICLLLAALGGVLSSSLRYMITGAVLAIPVIVDSLARKSRVSHGRA